MAKQQSDNTTIRFPLVGNYNTRLFVTGGSFTTICIVGQAVAGICVVGNGVSGLTSDQRFINIILDKIVTPINENVKFYCYKRPGLAVHNTPAAGSVGNAIKIWTGKGSGGDVISAFGDTNSTIYNGTSSIGSVTGKVREITETFVGTTPTLVFPIDNSRLYYYPDGGALTQVTDIDYPGEAGLTTTGTVVHLNGYAFIMTTDGRIWNSDLGSISAWSATSFVSSNMYPDKGVGLARYKDLIVAFGRETVEFFRDVGNATGSPLHRVPEGFIKVGAYSETAIAQLEDTVVWVSSSDLGGLSVYMLDGYKPTRISDNAIDNKIALSSGNVIHVTGAKLGGKTLFFISFAAVTFVYSVEDQTWHEWAPGGGSILWHKFAGHSSATPVNYSVSRTSTSGKVYKINPIAPVYTDDGAAFTSVLQTSKLDLGVENRKFLSRLTLVGDNDIQTHPVNISWSDDDYNTFSTPRTVDLVNNRKYLSNCGSFRRRAFQITDSTSRPFRWEALELDFKLGKH